MPYWVKDPIQTIPPELATLSLSFPSVTSPPPLLIQNGAANPLPPGLDDCNQAPVNDAPIPTHLLLLPLVPCLIKRLAFGWAESPANPLLSFIISSRLGAVPPPIATLPRWLTRNLSTAVLPDNISNFN